MFIFNYWVRDSSIFGSNGLLFFNVCLVVIYISLIVIEILIMKMKNFFLKIFMFGVVKFF